MAPPSGEPTSPTSPTAPASPLSSPAAGLAAERNAPTSAPRLEADPLLLPTIRERVRGSFRFLVAAQTVYALALLAAGGESLAARFSINALRMGVLLWCIRMLARQGTRREALTLAGLGLGVQFTTGAAMSIIRGDVLPSLLLVLVLTSITSVYIPWGARAQAVTALGAAFCLSVASAVVYHHTGIHAGLDALATIVTALAVTTWIAHELEVSRRSLEQRLRDARRADEELAALRDQLERRVAERTEALEQANRELEGFSYTVSHDLRSPLRSITGFSQLLLDEHGEDIPEAARSHMTKIQAAARRMDGLIDAMLLLARVGRSTLRYETVDLSDLARSVAADLAAEHPDRRIETRIDDIPRVPGDTTLLRAALDNLLRNAWKFTATREVGHVTVTGRREGDRIVCRVEDDGIGFDPSMRERLFHPFERLHDDRRFRGTGVGLATVARIVRRHGGDVEAEGSPDGGAAFTFWLPAERPPAAKKA